MGKANRVEFTNVSVKGGKGALNGVIADDIDIERAQAAYDREKKRLVSAGKGETEIDLPSVRAAIDRAANRIKVYNEAHGR